jgi:ubiquinone/menaquinone biosynthesis C-methylase UbiE
VGVDIVLEPLKTLMSYLRKPHAQDLQVLVVGGDVTKLPFRNGVFDIVTSFGVVEHFRSELDVIQS